MNDSMMCLGCYTEALKLTATEQVHAVRPIAPCLADVSIDEDGATAIALKIHLLTMDAKQIPV